MKIHDQKTADKIMNRATAIAKENKISLASAVGIAQNEDGQGTAHDSGQAEAEANAANQQVAWCQKRASEMRAENPTLSTATCLQMAIHEFHNQQWNLGK